MTAGMKWLRSASYIRPATIDAIKDAIDDAKAAGYDRIKVRPGCYIGEPSPVAVVTVGAGEAIFRSVYQ